MTKDLDSRWNKHNIHGVYTINRNAIMHCSSEELNKYKIVVIVQLKIENIHYILYEYAQGIIMNTFVNNLPPVLLGIITFIVLLAWNHTNGLDLK